MLREIFFRADNVWGDVGGFKKVTAFAANLWPISNPGGNKETFSATKVIRNF